MDVADHGFEIFDENDARPMMGEWDIENGRARAKTNVGSVSGECGPSFRTTGTMLKVLATFELLSNDYEITLHAKHLGDEHLMKQYGSFGVLFRMKNESNYLKLEWHDLKSCVALSHVAEGGITTVLDSQPVEGYCTDCSNRRGSAVMDVAILADGRSISAKFGPHELSATLSDDGSAEDLGSGVALYASNALRIVFDNILVADVTQLSNVRTYEPIESLCPAMSENCFAADFSGSGEIDSNDADFGLVQEGREGWAGGAGGNENGVVKWALDGEGGVVSEGEGGFIYGAQPNDEACDVPSAGTNLILKNSVAVLDTDVDEDVLVAVQARLDGPGSMGILVFDAGAGDLNAKSNLAGNFSAAFVRFEWADDGDCQLLQSRPDVADLVESGPTAVYADIRGVVRGRNSRRDRWSWLEMWRQTGGNILAVVDGSPVHLASGELGMDWLDFERPTLALYCRDGPCIFKKSMAVRLAGFLNEESNGEAANGGAGRGGGSTENALDKYDSNGDGRIDAAEFTALFNDFDTNGDGKLSVDEFVILARFLGIEDEDIAREIFAEFDTDDDGFLSESEARTWFNKLPDTPAGDDDGSDSGNDDMMSPSSNNNTTMGIDGPGSEEGNFLSDGAIAGIVVGSVCYVCLIIVFVVLFIRKRRDGGGGSVYTPPPATQAPADHEMGAVG